jgi:hypothetical protein
MMLKYSIWRKISEVISIMGKKTRRSYRQDSVEIWKRKKMLKKVNLIAEYTPKGQIQLLEEVIQRMVEMRILEEVESNQGKF